MALPPMALAADRGPLGGFGGTVIYENSLGRGTFLSDEFNRQPYWNMSFSIRPSYKIDPDLGITARMRLDISQNIVENSSSTNTRPHDVQIGDLWLYVSFTDFLKIEPAFLKFSGYAALFLPTSRVSDLTRKIIGTRLSATMAFEPLNFMKLDYSFTATKNFNRYTNSAVDTTDFDFPALSRAAGPEQVTEGLVATGKQITEWALAHRVGLTFTFLDDFAVELHWYYFQNFTYQGFEVDEFSSPHATGGRGYSDLMWGVIEVSYSVTDYLGVALGTLTEQTPKTSDNQDFRFPFWDTTNGSANRQTFYLDVVGTF